jgi:hypothetical protein
MKAVWIIPSDAAAPLRKLTITSMHLGTSGDKRLGARI